MAYTKVLTKFVETKSKEKINLNTSIAFYMYILIAFLSFFSFVMVYEFFTRATWEWSLFTIKYFTTISGYLMGIDAFIMAILFGLLKHGKIQRIKKGFTILNLVCTSCVCLTMAITIFLLTPGSLLFSDIGISTKSLYTWSNMQYHVIIPVLAMITFIFFAKSSEIKFVDTLYVMIPGALYITFYAIAGATHMKDGVVDPDYDWYGFYSLFNNMPKWILGLGMTGIGLLIISVLFGFSCLLRYGNKKANAGKFFINIFMQCFVIVLILIGTFWKKEGQAWWGVFKYFESFMGWVLLASIIMYIIYAARVKQGLMKEMPVWLDRFQIVALSNLLMIFIAGVFVYLPIFIARGMYDSCALLTDSGLYFRYLIPVIGGFSFMAFQHNNKLKFKETLFCFIAPVIYAFIYIAIVYAYRNSGLDPMSWDWYRVYTTLQNHALIWVLPVLPLPFVLLSDYILWISNKKMELKPLKVIIETKK